MAIEDAAVLGNLLSRITHISQLEPLLKVYQDLRLPRTAIAQEASRANQRVFHLPDGPEQKARDERMRSNLSQGDSHNTAEPKRQQDGGRNPEDKASNDALFSYDADVEVENWWASHGGELEALVRS